MEQYMAGTDSYACGSLLYGIWDFSWRAGSGVYKSH